MTEDGKKESLISVQPNAIQPVRIENLIVSPAPQKDMIMGDIPSLTKIVNDAEVTAVFWNEDEMFLTVPNRSDMIRFQPELEPSVAVFFQRSKARGREDAEGNLVRTWEGDYEPLQFKKGDFLKWVKKYSSLIPTDIVENVKSLKIKASTIVSEDMLDDEGERKTEDSTMTTNVPKRFTLNVPLMEGVIADLDFECAVVNLKDRYGNPADKRGIELRCTNAREVKKDLMQGILAQLPVNIPKYYGKIARKEKRDDEWT
jgi:hypothetical protein